MIFYTNIFFFSASHKTPNCSEEKAKKSVVREIYILINSHAEEGEQKHFRKTHVSYFLGAIWKRWLSRCLHFSMLDFFVWLLLRGASCTSCISTWQKKPGQQHQRLFLCIVRLPNAMYPRSRFLRDKLIAMPKLAKANTEVSCFMQQP